MIVMTDLLFIRNVEKAVFTILKKQQQNCLFRADPEMCITSTKCTVCTFSGSLQGKKRTSVMIPFPLILMRVYKKIVALASTFGLTCASNLLEENEYFYGDESTD